LRWESKTPFDEEHTEITQIVTDPVFTNRIY
jgi:hypothetical protein